MSIPSSSASDEASSSSTFASIDTTRSRTAGTCTRVSSNRKPRRTWAFSIAVWLFQKSRAWL
jgi:hypothetical protein